MQKKALDLKPQDTILVEGKKIKIEKIEKSDLGKHGKVKVRIEGLAGKEKIVLIRLSEDMFETA